MEQLSMPMTSAVVLVMRWRVVSRSSADPIARLIARRAEISAVLRLSGSWVTFAIGVCRHHTANQRAVEECIQHFVMTGTAGAGGGPLRSEAARLPSVTLASRRSAV